MLYNSKISNEFKCCPSAAIKQVCSLSSEYFQILAFFCIVCSAPAHHDSQHWFLAVVVISLLGTIFFSLYYLCLAEPLNKLQINWLMVVSPAPPLDQTAEQSICRSSGSRLEPHFSTSQPSSLSWPASWDGRSRNISTG